MSSYQPRKPAVDRARKFQEKRKLGGNVKPTASPSSMLAGDPEVGGYLPEMFSKRKAAPKKAESKAFVPTSPMLQGDPEVGPGVTAVGGALVTEQTPQAVEPEPTKKPEYKPRPVRGPLGTSTGAPAGGRDTIAPEGTPTSELTYDQFMGTIGKKFGLEVKNPFLSESFPGSNELSAQMELAPDSYQANATLKGDVKAKATDYAGGTAQLTTAPEGYEANVSMKSAELESQRQLTPGAEGSGRQMNAGSRAFLDYSGPGGSLGALRAAEAARGIIYQGQQHYARDDSSETGLRKISREAAGAVRFGASMEDAIANNPIAGAAKGKAQARAKSVADMSEGQKGASQEFAAADSAAMQNPIVQSVDGATEVIDNMGAELKARNLPQGQYKPQMKSNLRNSLQYNQI